MFLGVNVCADYRTSRMHPLVAIGVIEMPMSIDEVLDRVMTDRIQRLANFFSRARIAGVDDKFAAVPAKTAMLPPEPINTLTFPRRA